MTAVATRQVRVPVTTAGLKLQVRLTGVGRFRLRTWLGTQVLRLAGLVTGLDMEVSVRGGPRDPAPEPSLAVPPVRLSVDELTRGTAPVRWSDAQRIRVLLDGVEVREVIAYDCEAGTVERIKRDARGEPIVEGDKLAHETVHGTVIAEYREAA